MHLNKKNILNSFFRDITSMGGVYFYGFISLLFLLTHLQTGLKLIYALISIYIIAIIIRSIYFKNRPNKEKYNNYLEKIDSSSFPSIHSTRITFLFFTLKNFYNEPKITLFLTIPLFLVIYSRIYLKKHDTIDIFAGFILGFILFYFL